MNNIFLDNNYTGSRFTEMYEIEQDFSSIDLMSDSRDNVAAGIPICSDGRYMLVDDSDSSSIVVASTRAGKTRRVLMPYTFSAIKKHNSLIINDPKGEILRQTKDILDKENYKIIVLDYRNPMRGDRFNLFEYPARLYKSGERSRAIEIIQSISNVIMEKYKSEKDLYWHQAAAMFLTGLVIIACDEFEPEDVTFKTIFELYLQGEFGNESTDSVRNSNRSRKTFLEHYFIMHPDSLAKEKIAPIIFAAFETKRSVYAVFSTAISIFVHNEDINDFTSKSTFSMEDLLGRTALFFITRDETDVYSELITSAIHQMFTYLIDVAEEKYCGMLSRQTEFIIDEFGALSRIPFINKKLSCCCSRNIRFLLVCQSLEQMSLVYGRELAKIIIGNCNNLIYLHSPDIELLKMLSERAGTYSIGNRIINVPLVSVDLLQHLDKDSGECLMLLGRHYPYIGHLPDVSVYNIPVSEDFGLKKRERLSRVKIDFEKMLVSQFENAKNPINNMRNDSVPKINKKLVEKIRKSDKTAVKDDIDNIIGEINN